MMDVVGCAQLLRVLSAKNEKTVDCIAEGLLRAVVRRISEGKATPIRRELRFSPLGWPETHKPAGSRVEESAAPRVVATNSPRLGAHRISRGQGKHFVIPETIVEFRVDYGLSHHGETMLHLGRCTAALSVQLNGESGEVA